MPKTNIMKKVVRIDQSPMNKLIWICQLECGHDVYITQKSRPKKTKMRCSDLQHYQ